MGIRDAMLYAVDSVRAITGPNYIDIRPTTVQIITRTWSGNVRGDSYPTDSALALPPYTKVRHLKQSEIAASGGLFEEGDVIIGHITPQYTAPDGTTHGFTEAQLAPVVTGTGQEVIYRLTKEAGAASGIDGDYSRVELRRDHQYHFDLVVRRLRTTPGPT